MNLGEHLNRLTRCLTEAGGDEAYIEAEVMLRYVTELDRASFFLELRQELGPGEESMLAELVEGRLKGAPLPYLTGTREFYGLEFYVNHWVLIPRPETELLVEKTLQICNRLPVHDPVIADIGTGCGAIAISLAKELPQAKLYASDISGEAVEIARINCERHGVCERVRLFQGDLLEAIHEAVDIVVANLPYVKQSEVPLDSYEPRIALDGGVDGTAIIQSLIRQFALKPARALILEIGSGQANIITNLMCESLPGYAIELDADLSGIERIVSAFHPSCFPCPA